MKNIVDIKSRSRRPKQAENVTEYTAVKEVNDVIMSIETYFDDQIGAYGELKELHKNTSQEDIVSVSGIVEKAEAVESDLNWATDTLNCLNTRKKTLYSENEEHYLGYEFKEFIKPII